MGAERGGSGGVWGPSRSRSQVRRRRVYPSEVGAEMPPAVARLPGEGCQQGELSPASPFMAFSGGGGRGAWVLCAGVAALRACERWVPRRSVVLQKFCIPRGDGDAAGCKRPCARVAGQPIAFSRSFPLFCEVGLALI